MKNLLLFMKLHTWLIFDHEWIHMLFPLYSRYNTESYFYFRMFEIFSDLGYWLIVLSPFL